MEATLPGELNTTTRSELHSAKQLDKQVSKSHGHKMNALEKHKLPDAAVAMLLLLLLLALANIHTAAADRSPLGRRLADERGAARLPVRVRRQTSELHKLSVGQLAALNSEAERGAGAEQSLAAEADEQALRRQLPELLARAHNDKALERALLRLVISASLRNSNQLQQQLASSESRWQLDNLDSGQNNLAHFNQASGANTAEFNPMRLGRVESSELANLESQLAGELPELTGQFGSGSVDKREYLKPCSFNAISCVRTPFRRFQ